MRTDHYDICTCGHSRVSHNPRGACVGQNRVIAQGGEAGRTELQRCGCYGFKWDRG